ncbi:MAG: hypothetical protein HQK55_18810 [Deltaproteobacteria bacterium]|nr:hypothetical protein [Deltaproteobacteria bacterium]
MTPKLLGRIGYSNIYTFSDDPSAYFFEAGMAIDADGAPKAYHPKPGDGLDYLDNAGHSGNWWALVTKNGEPVVQGPGDPAPGYYISTTSLEDTSKKATDPTRYVDSETVPFFVLPGKLTFGASLGDFGVAVNSKNWEYCGCIFADTGPSGKIGEGSIALANALGVPSSPKHGGTGHGIVYVVFPGSKQHWPMDINAIKTTANNLFVKWGGIARLKTGLPDI